LIIDFEYERLKRSNHQEDCVDLLEKLLYSFGISDEDLKKEDYLKTFVKELELGPTPLTHFVRTYFNDSDAQFSADNILKEVPLHILSNLVEFIEDCWPQEKTLVKRFKVLLIGFGLKKLKLKSSTSTLSRIVSYLLDGKGTLEDEILSPPSNILRFPSFRKRDGIPI